MDCPSSISRYINNLDKEIRLLLLKLEDTEKIRVVENMQTCDEFGIYEPARTKISLLKTTTPQLIRFHVEMLNETDTVGLAIHRIEHNQRISQKWLREQQYKDRFSSEEAVQNWNNLYSKTDISQDDFKRVLEAISLDFNKASFETWLKPLEVIEVEDDEWTVSASNSYGGKWVVDHALEKLEAAAGVRIKIVCNGTVID
jgi:Asp-tRNA(Asn)/Glu-tRNA(Gln) amidotransferase C subunit